MSKIGTIISIILSCLFIASCAPEDSPVDPQDKPDVEKPDVGDTEKDEPEDDEPDEIVDPGWETAAEAVANMGPGWNLGNTLDCHNIQGGRWDDWLYWETYWGQARTTPELVNMISDAGFGAMRIPVTWGIHMDASGKVFDSWMNRVHEIVDYVLDAGMYCIINVHHDTGAGEGVWLQAGMDIYEKECDRYAGLWQQIAEEFKEYGHRLLFESYNEMLDTRNSWCYASFNGTYDAAFAADAYEAINAYAQTFVDVVRQTGGNNVARNLIVNTYGACSGSGNWNPHLKDPLKEMKLPKDVLDDHLIFEVHAYPSIDDISSMKAEVDDMCNALNEHLKSKGAPVIFGEWGTTSQTPSKEKRCEFIRYFVQKALENGMGTFYWMGLSDGTARALPAFSDPESALAILKGYHGDACEPDLPVIEDYEITYSIDYTDQWGEANIYGSEISLDEFSAVYLLLDKAPTAGELSVKVYGEGDKVQYSPVSSAEVEIPLKREEVGDIASRVTLQNMTGGPYHTEVMKAALIRKDGTKVICSMSMFWGGVMTISASLL